MLSTPMHSGVGRPRLSVAIPTRGNSRLVTQCISSILECAIKYGRTADLVISCDVDASILLGEAANAMRRWSRDVGAVEIIDRAARLDLVDFLVRSRAASRSIAEFAICGLPTASNYGAARNTIALCTSGRSYISFDDDTLCQAVTLPWLVNVDLDRWLPSGPDPIEYWFIGGPEKPSVATTSREVDILGMYESAFGRTVCHHSDSSGTASDGAYAGQNVVLCATGIAGDSGLDSLSSLVTHRSDTVWSRMSVASDEFMRIQSGCDVVRQTESVVFGRDPMFLATSYGVDGNVLSPPFLPAHRGEDAVFWMMLRKMHPNGICVHFPVCILHAPEQIRVRRKDFAIPKVFHFVAPLIARHCGSSDGPMTMERLGRILIELSMRPESEFTDAVFSAYRSWAASLIVQIEQLLDKRKLQMPDCAADLAHRQIALFEFACSAPQHAAPFELRDDPTPWRALARFVHSYGELLESWPAMLSTAKLRPRVTEFSA